MSAKYKLYVGNEEVKLTKNQQRELLKWRQTQIAQDMERKLAKINELKEKKGTLDC